MERKRQVNEDGRIWWKNTGGGSHRLHGKIIKPNQRFRAHPDEISEGFRDVIIPLSELPPSETDKPLDVIKAEYELRSRGAGGWFDIVNTATDKPVNDKALKRPAADKLLKELNA
jgi:hypothetical protein